MARVNSAVSRHIAKAPGLLRPVVTEEVAGNFGSMVLDSSGLVIDRRHHAERYLAQFQCQISGTSEQHRTLARVSSDRHRRAMFSG